jgi:leucyl-tRNA synthetase
MHQLPIVRVLAGPDEDGSTPVREAVVQTDGFHLVNSGSFSGLPAEEGFRKIVDWLEKEGKGNGTVQYRLYDWCISRQRYWGPPIPIVHCPACGAVPVPEQDLPVLLPEIPDFQPDDTGISPLARHKEWYEVPCPKCGGKAHRETDVSDTFLDSAWYYLRYLSTDVADRPFHETRMKHWLPVAMYIGGNEHAVLHLLYSRFIAMVLHDQGILHFEEPFRRFRAHGTIVKDGSKMSKSRGNVVIPDQYIARWGADTFRTYLMFLGPYQEGGDFRDEGLAGPRRFLDKVWELVAETQRRTLVGVELQHSIVIKWHQTIKRVTQSLESLSYNTAIAALMEMLNAMRAVQCTERRMVKDLVIMIAPFAPHFAEECWERLAGRKDSIFDQAWPTWEEALTIDQEVEIPVQVNGKTRARIRVRRGAEEPAVVAIALDDPQVRKFFDGETPKRVVYVKDRLLNLVANSE